MNPEIENILRHVSNILITTKKDYTIDDIASIFVLKKFFERREKNVEVAIDNFEKTASLDFISGLDEIKLDLIEAQKFIISLNIEKSGVKDFSYEVSEGELNIFITPKKGFFNEMDLSAKKGDFSFDLVITVGARDLDSLADIYEKNRSLFQRSPIMNFDNDLKNENYGKMNILDIKVSSVSENVINFLKKEEPGYEIDKEDATYLLAGIMSKNKAFKVGHISPQILETTSWLLEKGADKETVNQFLFKSKSIDTLKLWGRALARLKQEAELGLVWSLLTLDDFNKSGTSPKDIRGAIEELISNLPDSDIIVVIYEKDVPEEGVVCFGEIYTSGHFDSVDLVIDFDPKGSKEFAFFRVGQENILDAEKRVIQKIKEKIQSI
jgi:hypothetical protein